MHQMLILHFILRASHLIYVPCLSFEDFNSQIFELSFDSDIAEEDPSLYGFTFEIVDIGLYYIELQVVWTNSQAVSEVIILDKLLIEIDTSYFGLT